MADKVLKAKNGVTLHQITLNDLDVAVHYSYSVSTLGSPEVKTFTTLTAAESHFEKHRR